MSGARADGIYCCRRILPMARSSRTHHFVLLSSFVSLTLLTFAPLWAEEPTTKPAGAGVAAVEVAATPESFLRFVDDGKGGGRLETASVTYRNEDGVNVRL